MLALRQLLPFDNSYRMITVYTPQAMPRRDPQIEELRRLLRIVLRGLWRRRRPPPDLARHLKGDPPIGPRHMAILIQVGTEGERTVGELAQELGLSLPAASRLTRELEAHALVRRREHTEDRRRTVVDLNSLTANDVEAWLRRREEPLRAALAALTANEREAFLKGLSALADELMRESESGPLRPHHRAAHRRRPHRDRPV
jgi:DNA-binding MarR family transcriptional regulator